MKLIGGGSGELAETVIRVAGSHSPDILRQVGWLSPFFLICGLMALSPVLIIPGANLVGDGLKSGPTVVVGAYKELQYLPLNVEATRMALDNRQRAANGAFAQVDGARRATEIVMDINLNKQREEAGLSPLPDRFGSTPVPGQMVDNSDGGFEVSVGDDSVKFERVTKLVNQKASEACRLALTADPIVKGTMFVLEGILNVGVGFPVEGNSEGVSIKSNGGVVQCRSSFGTVVYKANVTGYSE